MLWTTFHILSLIILLGVSFPGLVRYPYHDIVCWAASTTGTTSFSTRVSSHRKESHTTQVASISSSLPSILPSGGLVNLGNTCYLNAQLQCAYHIPYIRELILNATSSSSSHYRPTSSPSHALKSLGHVFNSMKTASIQGQGQIGQISSVSTATLCKTLGINVFEQQDSQEFWKLLLPELQLPSLTNLYEGAYETFIVSLDGSGRERKRQETFLDLSLDIDRNKSVQDSLEDMFSRAELLSVGEGNGWRPDKNSDKVDALKGNSLHVAGLPKILQLHLLRFRFDWQTERMSKIHHDFEFPLDLDLSSLCQDLSDDEKEAASYTLHSIVVHRGEFGSGHYYSYIRPDVTKNVWLRYDDDRVTPVSFQQVKEDSFGGLVASHQVNHRIGWGRWFHGFSLGNKQYGSSAYVLQYVKKREIPLLWNVL